MAGEGGCRETVLWSGQERRDFGGGEGGEGEEEGESEVWREGEKVREEEEVMSGGSGGRGCGRRDVGGGMWEKGEHCFIQKFLQDGT